MNDSQAISIPPREVLDDEPVTTVLHFPVRYGNAGPADPTSEQMMRLVETSGVLDFWDDPDEDIYTREDGEPA